VPSVLAAFKELYPPTDIQLRVSNSPNIQELVASSEVDLAVVTNPSPADSLEMEPFKTFRICFFVSPAHPLAASKHVTGQMLARYPLVIGRAKKARSRTDELLNSMAAHGVKLNVLMRCEWPDAVKSVVREGEAIGILYLDNVEQGVRAGQFKIIDVAGVNLSIISYIVYPKEKALSQNAQEFLRFLRAACQTNALGKALLRNSQSLLTMLSATLLFLFDLAAM
jgi:DNA-binding transcriptional LysR family regulator